MTIPEPVEGGGRIMVDFSAWQLAVVPPCIPWQVQFHGPVPVNAEAIPLEQRLVGGYESVLLLSLPQIPFTGIGGGVTIPVSIKVICQLLSTAFDDTQNPNSACPSFAFQDSGEIVNVFPVFDFFADQRLISEEISKEIFQ